MIAVIEQVFLLVNLYLMFNTFYHETRRGLKTIYCEFHFAPIKIIST